MDLRHWIFYGLLAALTCATTALFVKLSLEASVTVLVFARSLLGLPIALWMIYKKRVTVSLSAIPKNTPRSLAGLAVLYTWFYAAERLPLMNSVLFLNTAPLFLPWILLIRNRPVSKWQFGASAIGFLGLAAVFLWGNSVPEWWNCLALAAGFFVAIAYIANRKLMETESVETALAYYFVICPFVSLIPLILYWEPIDPSMEWLYIALTGFSGLIYQFVLSKAYAHTPAAKIGILSSLSILFSGALGWLVFGEIPQKGVLLGAFLIIGCIVIAFVDHQRPLHHHDD